MKNIIKAAAELAGKPEAFALAVVISRDGSAPRGPGARMLVRRDGSIVGTIGGGLVEAEAIKAAAGCIESGESLIETYILSKEKQAGIDMTCGGEARVLLHYVSSEASGRFLMQGDFLVTQISGTGAPGEGPVDVDFRIMDENDLTAEQPHYNLLKHTFSHSASYKSLFPDDNSILIIEALHNRHCVYVCGGGHVGLKTAELADFAGFDTIVIDDRPEFADRERFPRALETVVAPGYRGLFGAHSIGKRSIGERSYIVILTRGHSYDQEVLQQALKTDASYIGMIGSRGKIGKIYDNLRAEGVTEQELERVHAPIGLPIGAETPAEIAVSIIAELIQHKAQKK